MVSDVFHLEIKIANEIANKGLSTNEFEQKV